MFNDGHMQYDGERTKIDPPVEPSLAEMVHKSINILHRANQGYILFVEGEHQMINFDWRTDFY